jgi:hypothetical protein
MTSIATLTSLADSIAESLNTAQVAPAPPPVGWASPFAVAFTAARTVLPIIDLSKIGDTLTVAVIPLGYEQERTGGGRTPQYEGHYDIDLLVQQRVGAGAPAEALVASLLLLQEQVAEYFKPLAVVLPDGRGCIFGPIEASPAYSQRALLEKNTFVGVQTWKFLVPS